MRINKFVAHATGLSRREVDAAISAGRVSIDGQKAILGAAVSPDDKVTLDNQLISSVKSYTYLSLNKPVGYLCSRRSQGKVPTVYSLLPENLRHLKLVGRLDKDSSGLILLTDDGDFAFRMTHPKFYKTKIYEVELDKPLQPLHQQMISDYGVQLEDGVSKFMVERLEDRREKEELTTVNSSNSFSRDSAFPAERGKINNQLAPSELSENEIARFDGRSYRVTMHEGRNRQIRRTFAALGYTVTRLHRTNFGNYSLGDIKSSKYAKALA